MEYFIKVALHLLTINFPCNCAIRSRISLNDNVVYESFIIQDTDCLVRYHTPVRKINFWRTWNFKFSPNWRVCDFHFRQFNFCLAIGEWRSVSVNP